MQLKTSFLLLLLLPTWLLASSALRVQSLRCEYLDNPLGIDVTQPRFSWILYSTARNQQQSAYEIEVALSSVGLTQAKQKVWGSGKITGPEQSQIPYLGPGLQSFTRYYWRVRVFDQQGQVSDWSEPAWFETAMLRPEDWQANWISDGRTPPEKEEEHYAEDPMPLFRKHFPVDKKLLSARLYICGLGYHDVFLNGKKVGNHYLDPGFTTYRKAVLYVVHDITPQIQKGNNILGVMLGNGWWNPLPLRLFGRFNLRDFQENGRPCLRAEVHLNYQDGSREIIASDENWQVAPGPILRNNVYLGEHYDARLERAFSENRPWANASLCKGPSGQLAVQMQPPIRITQTLRPRRVKALGKDTFLVDLGQNFAGIAGIRVQGPRGSKITLRYGEDTLKNGRLNWWTSVAGQIKGEWGIKGGPGAPATAWQEDVYILKGEGIEEWAPHFTFHGFRYIEVVGWPGTPRPEDFWGYRMNADLTPNGSFQCSNPLFNQVHEVTQWTFLSNVFSVQSDCPAREKMGYGADMVVSAEAFLYNYDMAQFYSKTVGDFANEQRPEGGITEIAPFTGIADRGYGDLSGPLGWQLGFPFLQKKLYEFYGDKRIIERYYPALERQMQFLQSKAVDHLFFWDISDHEALDTKPEAFTAAAFYYHHARLMAEFSGILNQIEAQERYQKLAANIKKAILNRYFVKGTGRFDNATQAAQLFALWYDLAPDRTQALEVLQQEFQRHQHHLSTGIFSTKFLFDVLRQENLNDWAYQIANQRDFPGWGFMLANGATTLWESWNHPNLVYSANHPMFGSIDEWFYRSLLGINPLEPGFAKVRIQAQPAGDLTWAKGTYTSIRGKIESAWEIRDGLFRQQVLIPANVRAEVWIKCKPEGQVRENGNPITAARYQDGYAVLEIGSGAYHFEAPW